MCSLHRRRWRDSECFQISLSPQLAKGRVRNRYGRIKREKIQLKQSEQKKKEKKLTRRRSGTAFRSSRSGEIDGKLFFQHSSRLRNLAIPKILAFTLLENMPSRSWLQHRPVVVWYCKGRVSNIGRVCRPENLIGPGARAVLTTSLITAGPELQL